MAVGYVFISSTTSATSKGLAVTVGLNVPVLSPTRNSTAWLAPRPTACGMVILRRSLTLVVSLG
ncbi:hypothetical protein D3C72_2251640 [compost metagenome]